MFELIDDFSALKNLQSFGPFDVQESLGGLELFKDGYYFGAVVNGCLYLRVCQTAQKKYQDYQSQPLISKYGFVFKRTLAVPAEICANREALCAWAQEALEGAKAEVK